MSMLEEAVAIAVEAHRGMVDKAGAPYILHPIRVMMKMDGEIERIAAVLHDVVEDTDWTLDGLAGHGFPAEVVQAVDALTRREGESYEDFVRRAAATPAARVVKRADIEDNLDLSRIADPKPEDHKRMEKYRSALALLEREGRRYWTREWLAQFPAERREAIRAITVWIVGYRNNSGTPYLSQRKAEEQLSIQESLPANEGWYCKERNLIEALESGEIEVETAEAMLRNL